MSILARCNKLGTTMCVGFALASLALCPKASAQQLTSCDSRTPSTPCIQRFLDPLPYPPFFQSNQNIPGVDSYEIAARQFQVQALSSNTGLLTTVWGYGGNGFTYNYTLPTTVCKNDGTDPTPANCFSVPGPTIYTQGTAVHAKWINDLVCHTGDTGCTVGHFFTYTAGVKPSFTNHWANPGGTCNNHATGTTDCQGIGGYTGPVPLVVHAHGEISASESDGIPEAWNLPTASSFSGFIGHGSDYCQSDPATFSTVALPARDTHCRTRTAPDTSYKNDGAARFTYPNRQFGTTLFYHDHSLGVTTENVYMGLAGFYLISGTNFSGPGSGAGHWCNGNPTNCGSAANPFTFADDLPADCSLSSDGLCHLYGTNLTFPSTTGGLPQGDCSGAGIQAGNCFLVPLAVGDRAFNADGSLKFSENGNVILVNGKSWPILNVQPRKYRFKMVVAAPTSRFDFTFPSANNDNPGTPTATMTVLGADSGNLPHPAKVTKLSLMPGERADVIVDFSQFFGCAPPFGTGCTVDLLNANGGGDTGTIMRFNVSMPIAGCDPANIGTCFPPTADTSCNLSFLTCTSSDTLPHRASGSTTNVRQVSLFDDHLGACGALNAKTNCVSTIPLPWDGASTENPVAGSTEIWELWDYQDSHPMHLHEAQFEVINREKISCVTSHTPCPVGPGPAETGFKDTVQANGGQITRIRVIFKGPGGDPVLDVHPGLFAWHCHINPHEDNEMMRPMCVGGSSTDAENFCN
jgi:spore coat protein A